MFKKYMAMSLALVIGVTFTAPVLANEKQTTTLDGLEGFVWKDMSREAEAERLAEINVIDKYFFNAEYFK